MANEKQEDTVDTFLEGVTFSRNVWTCHPTLVKDKEKIDKDTKHPVGAVVQNVTLDYTGVTKKMMLDKMSATYIIKYQTLARKKLSMLQDDDGNSIDTVSFKVVDLFTGRVSMSDSERAGKAINKISDAAELEKIGAAAMKRAAELKKAAKDAITHR